MLVAAEPYDAATLHATGAVHRLGELDDALAWARQLAGLAPLTIAAHKLALDASSPEPAVDELVAAARQRAWRSADAVEGREAFLAKRPPLHRQLERGGQQAVDVLEEEVEDDDEGHDADQRRRPSCGGSPGSAGRRPPRSP